MRIIELAKENRVKNIYFQKCQPHKYLVEHQELISGYVLSKKQIIKDQLFNIIVYLSEGNLSEAKIILDELSIKTSKLTNVELYWLMVGWINYFDEIDDLERMEIFFNKLKSLIADLPHYFKVKTENNFLKLQARFFIKNGIYLDNAETTFNDSLKSRRYFINVLNAIYYLGLIAFKQNKKEVALERLNFIVQTKLKELAIYHKALEIVEQISNEPTI